MYKLSPSTDTTGITEMGEIEAPPALIVKCFGPPDEGDGYKISGQFVFVDEAGEPFVVHDWKSTNLWQEGFPSPDGFWSSWEPEEFSVSSRD